MYNVKLSLHSDIGTARRELEFNDLAEALRVIKYFLTLQMHPEDAELLGKWIDEEGKTSLYCSNQTGRAVFSRKVLA